MEAKSKKLDQQTRQFIEKLKKAFFENELCYTHAYVFGSRALGTAHPLSDIDICLISSESKEAHLKKLMVDAIRIAGQTLVPADIVVFSATEFRTNKLSALISEIKSKGILIR